MVFKNVQALRAIAVLMVLFGHLKAKMGFDWLTQGIPLWYTGVDIFFAISGFIVCTVAYRASLSSASRIETVAKFVGRRVVRIFPLYWIVLLVATILIQWYPLKPRYMEVKSMWNYILLITKENAFVPQAWTLSFELFFYGSIAALLLLFPRHIFKAVACWIAIQLFLFAYATVTSLPEPRIVTSALVFEFGLGCLVAYLIQKGVRSHISLSLFFGFCFYAAGTGWTYWSGDLLGDLARTITFGVGAAFILYAAIGLELSGRLIFPRPLQYIGDASYSLYLWHQMLLIVITETTLDAGLQSYIPRPILVLSWFAIAIFAGLASYRWIEKPIISGLNRILGLSSRRDQSTRRTVEEVLRS